MMMLLLRDQAIQEQVLVEQAAWSVNGVRAIAERLRVRRTFDTGPSDTALALGVLQALEREPAAAGCRPRVALTRAT